jgi:hypothetical protein
LFSVLIMLSLLSFYHCIFRAMNQCITDYGRSKLSRFVINLWLLSYIGNIMKFTYNSVYHRTSLFLILPLALILYYIILRIRLTHGAPMHNFFFPNFDRIFFFNFFSLFFPSLLIDDSFDLQTSRLTESQSDIYQNGKQYRLRSQSQMLFKMNAIMMCDYFSTKSWWWKFGLCCCLFRYHLAMCDIRLLLEFI